jgi:hypothetical protein
MLAESLTAVVLAQDSELARGESAEPVELAKLEERLADMGITVCHYPPGTSKWNKGVHRLVSCRLMSETVGC